MKAKSTRVKLTDRFVKSATTDARKSPIFMDDEVIGFGVQVRETGRKSFTLDYMFEGRRRRFFIADFPDWSTNATREHTAGLTAFAALHESESGPFRLSPRRKNLVAIGGKDGVIGRRACG